MKSLTIESQTAGCYEITGSLTFSTINRNTLIAFAPALDNKISLKFKEVEASDSAGLALIFEWLKSAQNRQLSIHLENLPEQILALARLSGVESMLQAVTLPVDANPFL